MSAVILSVDEEEIGLEAFLADNPDLSDEDRTAVLGLEEGASCKIGGGAGASFVVTRKERG